MKKFLLHLSLFSLALSFGYGSFAVVVRALAPVDDPRAESHVDMMRIKHQRAIHREDPAVIFVGGSSLLYGIDVEAMEERLGVPVLNMGLTAKLGLDWMLGEAKLVARPGDMVILNLEFFLDEGDYRLKRYDATRFEPVAGLFEANILEELRLHVRVTRERFDLFLARLDSVHVATSFLRSFPPTRHRQSQSYKYDERGDFMLTNYAPSWFDSRQVPPLPKDALPWDGIEKINEFSTYAKQHDIAVFLLYPCFPHAVYETWQETLEAYHRDNTHHLQIPILNRPDEFLYPDNAFHDSEYHLRPFGKEYHSGAIIQRLLGDERITTQLEQMAAVRVAEGSR